MVRRQAADAAAHEVPMTRGGGERSLRAWLADVAELAIDWLDALDAASEDLEDDELGDDAAREG
jgi:hypothetical protein